MSQMSQRTVTATRPVSQLRADARGVYILWYRDLLRWWRDRQRILPSLVQPVLYLFVFGVGLGSALGGGLPSRGPGAVAVGKALGGSTVALLQASLLLLLSPLVGVWLSPLALLQTLALLFLLAFVLSSIGVAVASRMRTLEGF